MENLEEYIKLLVKNGGPEPSQYEELNQWFQDVGELVRAGEITRSQVKEMWEIFGEAFSGETMQGLTVAKPYGYSGDFEIIDKIYTLWISPEEHLKKWDYFSHWQEATVAVRNRKEYFKKLLSNLDNSEVDDPIVLNIGSGPGRDIYEYQQQNPSTSILFECLDMDQNAIEYSKRLLNGGGDVTYYCQNAFRFRPEKKYNFIWSAGLFDYLEEKQFVFLFQSLANMLAPGGELVVGNFSESNPSRDYMEFGEWFLYHRTENDLLVLADQAGCSPDSVCIESETSGVNLFIRHRKLKASTQQSHALGQQKA